MNIFLKRLISTSLLCVVAIAIIMVIKNRRHEASGAITIGILQTASHPALDQARDGFIAALEKGLGNNVNLIIQNGQGSANTLQSMAKSLHVNSSIKGIFAIATPATQAIAHIEKQKPIFISAVTDPEALGLRHPNTNVCGSSDMIDVEQQVADIKKLFPSIKKVGLLFNPSEINSVTLVRLMKQELEKQGISTTEVGINSEAEVATAVGIACRTVDALLAPTDNTVASAITIASSLCRKAGKPLIVSDNLLVSKGALCASGGIDYFVGGTKAGEVALKVLVNNQKPAEIKVEKSTDPRIFINESFMKDLEIQIPQELRDRVVLIK